MQCSSLVVACGGKSIPKMGATGFGYDIAAQFGLRLTETRARPRAADAGAEPAGAPRAARRRRGRCGGVAAARRRFTEAMLFTHRGLCGPAILQISSYWREGEEIALDMLPGDRPVRGVAQGPRGKRSAGAARRRSRCTCPSASRNAIAEDARRQPATLRISPTRLCARRAMRSTTGASSRPDRKAIAPPKSRSAASTPRDLDSRTMAAREVPGLYFIGEVVDVTGWLGGYNFQWAWSSGWCAGQAV